MAIQKTLSAADEDVHPRLDGVYTATWLKLGLNVTFGHVLDELKLVAIGTSTARHIAKDYWSGASCSVRRAGSAVPLASRLVLMGPRTVATLSSTQLTICGP